MKRIFALLTATIALSACSSPTAPTPEAKADVAKAKLALHGASKMGPGTTTGRIAAN